MITRSLNPFRLIVALAIILFPLAGCASSQDVARDDDRVARQLVSIDAAVDLTDAQAERVHEILAATEADRPSGPPPRGGQAGAADRRAERDAHRAEQDQRIEDLLTEEQVERYRAWRASQPERPQGPPRRGQ